MVGGAHDDEGDHQRIADARDLRPGGAPVPPQHGPAPQGPAHVEARHGRVLIGQAAQAARGTGVAAPPAVRRVLLHRVDEAVTGLEQPRRARGEEGESDETDERGDHQPGAHPAVVVGAAPEEPDQKRGREQVVQRGVREVRGYADPGVPGEEPVERVLEVYSKRFFKIEDRQAVAHGILHIASDQQPAHRVQPVHHGYQGQFGPPARPLPQWCGAVHPDGSPLFQATKQARMQPYGVRRIARTPPRGFTQSPRCGGGDVSNDQRVACG